MGDATPGAEGRQGTAWGAEEAPCSPPSSMCPGGRPCPSAPQSPPQAEVVQALQRGLCTGSNCVPKGLVQGPTPQTCEWDLI